LTVGASLPSIFFRENEAADVTKIYLPAKLSPKEVNNQLVDIFGIGLFRFAQIFAIRPADTFIQKQECPFTSKEISKIKSALRKTWKSLLKNAEQIETLFSNIRETPVNVSHENELLNDKAFRDFYIRYLAPRAALVTHFEKRGQLTEKGTGLNKKTIIAVGWANLVSHKCRKIDWHVLGDLYFWFWEKIRQYEFYGEWEPTAGIEDYLKTQFHRYRIVGGIENYIADNPQIPDILAGPSSHQFWRRLLLYRWAEGQIPEAEILRFILNFSTDRLLAAGEGITIFAPSESFADSMFTYLSLLLKKERNVRLSGLVDSPYLNSLLSGADSLLTEGTEVRDYLLYAIDIMIDKKVDLGNLPPTIVFPGPSCFSTRF
jgi:hypothetical protein